MKFSISDEKTFKAFVDKLILYDSVNCLILKMICNFINPHIIKFEGFSWQSVNDKFFKHIEIIYLIIFCSSYELETEESLCLICDKAIAPEKLETVKEREIQSFIKARYKKAHFIWKVEWSKGS